MKSPAELLEDNSSGGRPLRIAIISRRFWPFAGSTEFAVSDLASAIQRAGHHVDIVTVRWEKSWPQNFEFRELPVHRINRPPTGAWGAFRYLRNLIRQLNELQPDGIVVFGLGEEAWTIAKSYGGKIPFVIRLDNHLLGFRDGKANLNHRQIASLNLASQVIVESQWTADRLKLCAALKQDRIVVVPDGITIDPQHQRSIAKQGSARVAISDAHPMLMIESTQPLVVCGSPMNGDPGIIDLVNAWPAVQQRFPSAKLWIFGEGKQSLRVWDQVQENHLINSVIMPGSFDHLSVVFSAADIYVHPLRSGETCGFLARAMVSGVCSVVTSTAATIPVIEDDKNGILVPIRNQKALSSAIIRGLDDSDLRDRLGHTAMKSSQTVYDIDELLHHFLDPFVGLNGSDSRIIQRETRNEFIEFAVSQRILFVIESLFPLGPAQQLKLLADELVARDREVHIAVLGEKTFEPVQWTDAGMKVCFLNGDDQTPLHTFRDGFYVAGELRKLIRSLAPEIVHTWCGPAEILTLVATEDIPFTRRLKRMRLISTELFRQPDKRFVRQSTEHRMTSRVERMVVPHESVKIHLIENGYREERIEIIPNAIPRFDPIDRQEARNEIIAALNLPEQAYLAGAVSPLCHRTRLKDLIWATDLLTVIRDDFHFLIIGKGSQLKQLKRFAGLTESRTHVHFLGHPDSPERVVAGLDFYWHSHLRDPLSGNLLGAMANGIPAISVYGPGTEEIIRHQQTAFGVNFGARDEFARWTKFLIEKTEPAEKIAWQGQQFVQDRFDRSKMIDGYLAIYDDLERNAY